MNQSAIFSIRNDNANITYPDFIYLDTSFVYKLYGDDNADYKKECVNFLTNAVYHETIPAYSGLVLDELKHIILVNIYDKEAENQSIEPKDLKGKTIPRWKLLFAKDTCLMDTVMNEYERVKDFLEQNMVMLEYVDDEDFRKLVDNISFKFGLDSYDARHTGIALVNGINSIATLDEHFVKVYGMNIYGPNKGIIKHINSKNNDYIKFNEYDFVELFAKTSLAE